MANLGMTKPGCTHGRKSRAQIPGRFDAVFSCDLTRAEIGVEARADSMECDFDSGAFDIRESIGDTAVCLIHPDGQTWVIALGRVEEKNFLARRENPVAEGFGKELAQP